MTKHKLKKKKAYLRGWLYGAFDQLVATNASEDSIRIVLSNWNIRVGQLLPHHDWKWVSKVIKQVMDQFGKNSSFGFCMRLKGAVANLDEKGCNENKGNTNASAMQ